MVAVAARPVCRSAADQTLSDRAQHVLAPEFRTREGATAVVFRMLEKAAERMRHEGYHAQRLEVHVLSTSEPYWTRRTDFLPCPANVAQFLEPSPNVRHAWGQC
jgi:hypothetical protein